MTKLGTIPLVERERGGEREGGEREGKRERKKSNSYYQTYTNL